MIRSVDALDTEMKELMSLATKVMAVRDESIAVCSQAQKQLDAIRERMLIVREEALERIKQLQQASLMVRELQQNLPEELRCTGTKN